MQLVSRWSFGQFSIRCCVRLARYLKPAPLLALSLLHHLRQEPLGHRLPLPHVPRFCGYVVELPTKWRCHSGLANVDDVAMGIVLVYAISVLTIKTFSDIAYISAYLSISFSLNVLLTLMIVIRIILHARNTRAAVGISGIGGLSKAIVTMLVESCALYAMGTLLVLGRLGSDDNGGTILGFFLPIVNQTQVRASP